MQANQLLEFPLDAVSCIVILNCSNVLFALEKASCSNNTMLQFAASRHMGRRKLLDDRIGIHGRLTCRCTFLYFLGCVSGENALDLIVSPIGASQNAGNTTTRRITNCASTSCPSALPCVVLFQHPIRVPRK